MATKLFVNLPVKDLDRAREFFTALGLTYFGATEDMASVVISEHTQVMLLAESTFTGYARNPASVPCAVTETILVLGLQNKAGVDELVDRALAAGATQVGEPTDESGRYQRGFTDLDGHQWAALCLV